MNGEIIKGPDQDFNAGGTRAVRGASAPAAFRLDIRRAFALHRGLAIGVGLAVFLLVIVFTLSRPARYLTEIVFYVAPVQKDVLPQNNAGQPAFDSMRYEATLQQLIQTMQRLDVAEAAVRSLPEGVFRKPNETEQAAAARLLAGLSVLRSGTSFQLTADLSGSDAEGTAAALNALSKAFIAQMRSEDTGSSEQQLQVLHEEQKRVLDTLATDRLQQAALAAKMGVAKLSKDEASPLDTAVADVRHELAEVQRQRELGPSGGGGGNNEEGGASTVSGLIAQLNARKALLQSQMAGMTAANPIRQQDESELASTERQLSAATQRYASETRLRDAERQAQAQERANVSEARLRGELVRQTQAAAKAAPQVQEYTQLSSDIERLQTRSDNIDETIRGINLERKSPGQIRVVVPATTPLAPEPGKRNLMLLAAVPLALIAAIFAAALVHSRDRRVFLARDVEQVLGFRPMATLPAPEEVSDAVHSAYLLRLASSIENSYRNAGARTFVFTAPNINTNVEDLVFRLQLKMKELGYSALWVGSDTLLRSERDFEEAYDRGPFMHAEARTQENGVDGIAAARLAWLKRDYDLVLIDAPPITLSGEAEYAVRRCDATILVNESGVTTRDDLQQAGEILERIGLGGVGTVIKDLHLADADLLFRNAVRLAEVDLARRVSRDPRDDHGTWQLLHAGTDREIILPGDPVVGSRRRKRSDRSSSVRRYTAV